MSLSNPIDHNSKIKKQKPLAPAREAVFWRVEGSLLNLTAVRPVGFFAWNSQSFLQRWSRRGAMATLALARPLLYVTNREFATRLLHTVLRGVSRDRLDLLGEEFVEYFLKPRLKARGVALLNETIASGGDVVLVSQGLEHIMRPLAKHLGVKRIIANRLDFRDGKATGRLLDPLIRPRGLFARFTPVLLRLPTMRGLNQALSHLLAGRRRWLPSCFAPRGSGHSPRHAHCPRSHPAAPGTGNPWSLAPD